MIVKSPSSLNSNVFCSVFYVSVRADWMVRKSVITSSRDIRLVSLSWATSLFLAVMKLLVILFFIDLLGIAQHIYLKIPFLAMIFSSLAIRWIVEKAIP
jgi:hypothetical protein